MIIQGFTGVPCIVDLVTICGTVKDLGDDPEVISPQIQSDMVIDHSVQVDKYGITDTVQQDMDIEYQCSDGRYQFLRQGWQIFKNSHMVLPGTDIIHQVNIEYLTKVVMSGVEVNGNVLAYLDSCVGTDSHTTTEGGLGVPGWNVGGIEAEAIMLSQPISIPVSRVISFELTGSIPEGITTTDVVLTITDMLRKYGVISKSVEFYGKSIASVPLADHATIGNIGSEFDPTCGTFPIDSVMSDYLCLAGRSEEQVALVEAYAKTNRLWSDVSGPDYVEPQYSKYEELGLGTVVPSIAGPKRPRDHILLSETKSMFEKTAPTYETKRVVRDPMVVSVDFRGDFDIENDDVAIALVTSCTNASNPSVMIAAGPIAHNAHVKDLKPKPQVEASLAPDSQVVADYFRAAGLQNDLDAFGYQLVGFDCATCIGNSDPLPPEVSKTISTNDLTVTTALSGNRNLEGRINPSVKMNYLVSPPLVIAYTPANAMDFDLGAQPLGIDADGDDAYLKDIWPTNAEVVTMVDDSVSRGMFLKDYASALDDDHRWKGLDVPEGKLFAWSDKSTYVRKQTFFDGMKVTSNPVVDIHGAHVLTLLGDSVVISHISPAGAFKAFSPTDKCLIERDVEPKSFNSYNSHRGDHGITVHSTFSSVRLRNQLLASVGKEVIPGGFTCDFLAKEPTAIFEASRDYIDNEVPLAVLAGRGYGTGSSCDWTTKGTMMFGVKAVVIESFERTHRPNLIGTSMLPLQFPAGGSYESLGLNGIETYNIAGVKKLNEGVTPRTVHVIVTREDGSRTEFDVVVHINTPGKADYYRSGGILQYVLRNLTK